ncbi:MAG: DNA-3-methyladenine glycosylase, partial [Calditrichaeota bacterium]
EHIATSSRIGIGEGKEHPWRFFIASNPFVSRKNHR